MNSTEIASFRTAVAYLRRGDDRGKRARLAVILLVRAACWGFVLSVAGLLLADLAAAL